MIEEIEWKSCHTVRRAGGMGNECLRLMAGRRAMVEMLIVPVSAMFQLGELRPLRLDHQTQIGATTNVMWCGIDPIHIRPGHCFIGQFNGNAKLLEADHSRHQQVRCRLLTKVSSEAIITLQKIGELIRKIVSKFAKHRSVTPSLLSNSYGMATKPTELREVFS